MILFEHVFKTFANEAIALSDLCLEIKRGETLVLLGTSGSGKTTALRLINRLIEPTSGTIVIDGEEIGTIDPIALRRKIGYAVQSIGLFPNMTVAENISLVPRLLKWDEAKIEKRVDELLLIVGLDPAEYRSRYPIQLSGGQKQRVGVARALAADPPIILMDEPFGSLDPLTREQLQHEFMEIKSEINKTVVFVTHDVLEAVKIGDRIALLDKGQLVQLCTPAELVENPANSFVDHFLGKQRFQLSLLTRRLQQLLPSIKLLPQKELGAAPRLRPNHSFLEALNLFKISRKETLPLFRGKEYLGEFHKNYIFDSLLKII